MEQPILPQTMEDALIPSLPPSAYYIPNFITAEEEAHLLNKVVYHDQPYLLPTPY